MMTSAASTILPKAVESHLVPVVRHVGMSQMANPGPVRPGIVARTLGRALRDGRSFILQIWCEASTSQGLTWRFDVRDGDLWHDLQLTFPFDREGYSPARPSGGSHSCLQEFHPHRSPANFDRAVQFLAALFVTHAPEISRQVPELLAPLEAAASAPEWRAALLAGPRLWSHRAVTGDIDPTELAATIVFVGANLLVLDAGGRRVSFKFPVQGISKTDGARVSGWWTTPAGTHAATVLRIGSRTWQFEPSGKLVATSTG